MIPKSKSLQWLLLGTGIVITSVNTEAQQKPGRSGNAYSGSVNPVKATVGGGLNAAHGGGPKQSNAAVDQQAAGEATIANGQVTGVKITDRGQYSPRAKLRVSVIFSGGGGSGATGTVELRTNGYPTGDGYRIWMEVKRVELTNPGTGYTSPPTVTFVVQ